MMNDIFGFGLGHMFGFGGTFFPFFMIAVWGLIFWGAYSFIKTFSQNGTDKGQPDQEDRSLSILKERYAKGEISKEELEEKIRVLSGLGPNKP